jgi:hypothetical protein
MYCWDAHISGGLYVQGTHVYCDEATKHDIKPQHGDALGLVAQIELFEYEHDGVTIDNATTPGPDEHVSYGFLAQQLQKVMPEAVALEPPSTDTKDIARYCQSFHSLTKEEAATATPPPPVHQKPRYLTVDALQVTALNTRAIQQLNDEITALRAEIATLRNGRNGNGRRRNGNGKGK